MKKKALIASTLLALTAIIVAGYFVGCGRPAAQKEPSKSDAEHVVSSPEEEQPAPVLLSPAAPRPTEGLELTTVDKPRSEVLTGAEQVKSKFESDPKDTDEEAIPHAEELHYPRKYLKIDKKGELHHGRSSKVPLLGDEPIIGGLFREARRDGIDASGNANGNGRGGYGGAAYYGAKSRRALRGPMLSKRARRSSSMTATGYVMVDDFESRMLTTLRAECGRRPSEYRRTCFMLRPTRYG
ncbi:MAG: hypothetical protein ACYTEX_27060 [Planctomycetota bacterium]|jgi:hypothetical protein